MSQGTHPFLYLGEVVARDDSDGLGRVKILIPGVIEPSTRWAYPMGAPGAGTKQRGHYEPPAIGANVVVQFLLGDPDHPYYATGPWGDPGGVKDTPTNAAVEGDDRQNAVTEDEEWRIERDSRSNGQKYLIRHKGSTIALLIDAENNKVKISREDAGQKAVRGTDYRIAEALFLNGFWSALYTFLNSNSTWVDAAAIASAAAAAVTAMNLVSGQDMKDDNEAYLSSKVWLE
jgi:hypothetical protein